MKLLNRLRALQNRDEEIDDVMFSQFNFTIDSDEYSSDIGLVTDGDYELEIEENISLSSAELIDLVEEKVTNDDIDANILSSASL